MTAPPVEHPMTAPPVEHPMTAPPVEHPMTAPPVEHPMTAPLPSPSARTTALALGAITLLGLALRAVALARESAWFDEAYSLMMVDGSLADLFDGTRLDPGNPPGYYALLHLWLDALGLTRASPPDALVAGARALSVLASTLTIPLAFALARAARLPHRTALLAAALVALSPPLVDLAREARVFALATLVLTLHAWAALRLLDGDRLRHWLTYALTAAALPWLHFATAFPVLALGAWLAAHLYRRRAARPRALWLLLAAALLAALAFTPWLGALTSQLDAGAARVASSQWKHLAFYPAYLLAGRTLVWSHDPLALLLMVSALACLLWLGVALALRARLTAPLRLLLALGLGAPALALAFSLLVAPLFQGRYLSPILPALLTALAFALTAAPRRLARALALGLAALTLASLARLHLDLHREPWREVAQTLASADLPVVIFPASGQIPLGTYHRGPALPLPRPLIEARLATPERDLAPLVPHAPAGTWLVLYDAYDPSLAALAEALLAELRADRPLLATASFMRVTVHHLGPPGVPKPTPR